MADYHGSTRNSYQKQHELVTLGLTQRREYRRPDGAAARVLGRQASL